VSNDAADRYRPVRGWAEILYRSAPLITKYNRSTLPLLIRLKQQEYTPVGSWLPTEEFIHTFDIMELLQGPDVTDLFNIDRPIQPWDAINLCPMDPAGIKTLIVVSREHYNKYAEHKPQVHAANDLMLVTRSEPFQSFRYPAWPNQLS
jgi:hypothetical protein